MGDDSSIRIVRSLDEIHADPNDDLIPLLGANSTMQGPNAIEPIRPRANNARVIQDPDNPGVWRYVFHPREMYSANWLNQHELRYAAFLRNTVVDFARSVAGGLNRPNASDLLETGFEDINRIMRDATARHEMSMYGRMTGPAELDDVTESTRRELEQLTTLIREAGAEVTARDITQLMHNLTHMNQQHEGAVVRWLTLPYNLRRIYFKPVLKRAVERALDKVRKIAHLNTPVNELFSDLISGEQRTDFVDLVVLYVRLAYHGGIGGYNRTPTEERLIKEEIDTEAADFARYMPELPPQIEQRRVVQPSGSPQTISGITPPINSILRNPI